MITIKVFGLDYYTIGRYSREHTANLAQLFETSEDNISFFIPDGFIFHKGVEQTSWNPLVKVNAPEKFKPFEEKVAKYLIETLKIFTINLAVEFEYFHDHHRYEHFNSEYPRFLTKSNIVDVEESSEDEEDIYMGNVFEGMEEKLDEAYNEHHCDCDGECEEGDCDCEGGECHCGHHHEN